MGDPAGAKGEHGGWLHETVAGVGANIAGTTRPIRETPNPSHSALTRPAVTRTADPVARKALTAAVTPPERQNRKTERS